MHILLSFSIYANLAWNPCSEMVDIGIFLSIYNYVVLLLLNREG